MGKIICVVSGKGGVGKTTATANIGVSLSLLGKETLLIDADLGLRNLDLALGMQDSVMYDVLDVASGGCKTREAILKVPNAEHLSFMPAAQFKDKTTLSEEDMRLVCDLVREKFDYILIDCPAGLTETVRAAAACSDMAIVVVNPDPFSLRDGDRAAEIVTNAGVSDVKLIVNRFKKEMVQNGKMLNILQVIEEMALQIVGAVPDDDSVMLSVIESKPIAFNENEPCTKCYKDIALRLTGKAVPLTEIEPKKGFFKRVFHR